MQKVDREEDLDAIDDLMELDVLRKVYKTLIEDETLSAGVGKLPKFALCYIGNNLASSYCERANSCAKLIMTHDRTWLDDSHLEKICFLRMNKKLAYRLRQKYSKHVQKWMAEKFSIIWS